MKTTKKHVLARLTTAKAATSADSSRSFQPVLHTTPPLPPVNWAAVGQQPPKVLSAPAGDLPSAAAVVLVWTEAEWAAMQHVFCNSSASMPYSSGSEGSWSGWQTYAKGIPSVSGWSYWGDYRLVQIGNSDVLLFKSNTHLDFPGQQYLAQLIARFIESVKPQLILSTGTAGGARPTDHIGTVNVVRAATLYETNQPQSKWPEYSNPWKANWTVPGQGGFSKLLFPVPTTAGDLQSICTQFNSFYKSNDALNVLNPGNVNMADSLPAVNNLTTAGMPLLTTDSFVVGTSSGNLGSFACVEMDDAIIAKACAAGNVAYGSVRNISDPVQNAALPAEIQAHWGQAIYDAYGIYTSYNSAIAAWAILSGQFQ
jgi:nucleoside phosphorylase